MMLERLSNGLHPARHPPRGRRARMQRRALQRRAVLPPDARGPCWPRWPAAARPSTRQRFSGIEAGAMLDDVLCQINLIAE